ncbi:MAG: RecB family exonuclease [Acidimicrobiales bacterium]
MPFDPPRSLSPSKVSAFRDCALAFRFTSIERIPEDPTIWTVRGTLVHRALEGLLWNHRPGDRSKDAAMDELERAWVSLQVDPEFVALRLTQEQAEKFRGDSRRLVANYFVLEDPDTVDVVGVELLLEATVGSVRIRGIIDRLDRNSDGDLVVVDYKTGRAPNPSFEQAKMLGVHTYALLCEEVLGERPVEVRLLHLKEPMTISAVPSDQVVRALRQKTMAVWSAIERACRTDDFRPRRSPLCAYCRFQPYCPAFGGDPDRAAIELGEPGRFRGGQEASRR